MVEFSGQYQGRALRVLAETGEVEQALAVLPVTGDLGGRQALHLPQQGLAKCRGNIGLLQLLRVEQVVQGGLGEGLLASFGEQAEALFEQAP